MTPIDETPAGRALDRAVHRALGQAAIVEGPAGLAMPRDVGAADAVPCYSEPRTDADLGALLRCVQWLVDRGLVTFDHESGRTLIETYRAGGPTTEAAARGTDLAALALALSRAVCTAAGITEVDG